jgi:hypothetical protein
VVVGGWWVVARQSTTHLGLINHNNTSCRRTHCRPRHRGRPDADSEERRRAACGRTAPTDRSGREETRSSPAIRRGPGACRVVSKTEQMCNSVGLAASSELRQVAAPVARRGWGELTLQSPTTARSLRRRSSCGQRRIRGGRSGRAPASSDVAQWGSTWVSSDLRPLHGVRRTHRKSKVRIFLATMTSEGNGFNSDHQPQQFRGSNRSHS